MKDVNAAIMLLEKWPEKISGKGRGFESHSEPEIFSGHFSSNVMAAFASFIRSNLGLSIRSAHQTLIYTRAPPAT